MKLSVVCLLVVLMTWPVVASPNLVQDGQPDKLPDKASLPPDQVQEDSGAEKYFLNPGSTAMPGWTVTKSQIIIYDWSKVSTAPKPYLIDLHGAGGIQQTIPTVPGQSYRLVFDMASQNNSTVKVTFGGDPKNIGTFSVEPHAPPVTFTATFTASQPQTLLSFQATKEPHYGPYLTRISLTLWDPQGDAMRAGVDGAYRAAAIAFQSGDFNLFGSVLTDDFAYHPKSGSAQDKAAYLQSLQDARGSSGQLSASVESVSATADGATAVTDLYLRTNEGGTKALYESRVQDVWVKQGDAWHLKARTEQAAIKTNEP